MQAPSTQAHNLPKLLTRAELAEVYRTSESTIKRYPKSFPPAIRVGRQWRYRLDDALRCLDTSAITSTTSPAAEAHREGGSK